MHRSSAAITSREQHGTSDYAVRLAETEAISRLTFDVALGSLKTYLDDPSVQNVNVNADGRIWIDRGTIGKVEADARMPSAQREILIGLLANRQHSAVDRLHSRLAGDLPYYDVRFQAFAPPIADWALCLRCHAAIVRPLEELAIAAVSTAPRRATRTPGYVGALMEAIARESNIAIVGQPGSGKTTLLNSALQFAAQSRPGARLVTLEDRRELKPSHGDTLQLYGRVEQARLDGTRYEYGFVDLLSDALRTSFDVLAFGELRDGESAHALLMALNCGTSGLMFTLHADSARDALARLEDLVRLSNAPVIRRTISRFVNAVIFLSMDDERRRGVGEMIRVRGVDADDAYVIEEVAP